MEFRGSVYIGKTFISLNSRSNLFFKNDVFSDPILYTRFLFKKHKFKKHEAQNAEILRNIARLTLTNITGKITYFNTGMF